MHMDVYLTFVPTAQRGTQTTLDLMMERKQFIPRTQSIDMLEAQAKELLPRVEALQQSELAFEEEQSVSKDIQDWVLLDITFGSCMSPRVSQLSSIRYKKGFPCEHPGCPHLGRDCPGNYLSKDGPGHDTCQFAHYTMAWTHHKSSKSKESGGELTAYIPEGGTLYKLMDAWTTCARAKLADENATSLFVDPSTGHAWSPKALGQYIKGLTPGAFHVTMLAKTGRDQLAHHYHVNQATDAQFKMLAMALGNSYNVLMSSYVGKSNDKRAGRVQAQMDLLGRGAPALEYFEDEFEASEEDDSEEEMEDSVGGGGARGGGGGGGGGWGWDWEDISDDEPEEESEEDSLAYQEFLEQESQTEESSTAMLAITGTSSTNMLPSLAVTLAEGAPTAKQGRQIQWKKNAAYPWMKEDQAKGASLKQLKAIFRCMYGQHARSENRAWYIEKVTGKQHRKKQVRKQRRIDG
jgi:hypothetical protein